MAYLLDTNIIILILKKNSPLGVRAADRLLLHDPQEIRSCSVVDAELFHGAEGYGVPERRRSAVSTFLYPYVSHAFDPLCVPHYAKIRHHLEKQGNIIGGNDLMIAATALAYDLTVVTHNSGEFSRVPGLKWEDWS